LSPPLNRIESDPDLPTAADVVVIGGGIVGVTAAIYLSRKGLSVALLEKGHVGAEQSSRNWGWCRQQLRARQEIPIARESLRLWEDLERETAADTGFRRSGVLFVTKDPAELASWERWTAIAREEQVHSVILSREEVAEKLRGNGENWSGGLWTPNDGRAEPSLAAPALATAARAMGVRIHQGCAARGLDIKGGVVAGVVTENGRIRADAVLLAGGAWSSLFCRRHGIDLPIGLVNATACRTTPAPEIGPGALGTSDYCVRRREDGCYTLGLRGRGTVEVTPDLFRYSRQFFPTYLARRKGLKLKLGTELFRQIRRGTNWNLDAPSPFEEVRVLDPAPDLALSREACAGFAASNPALARLEIAEAWGGTIDTTPDAVPVISRVARLSGLTLATGFSGHGFGIGPGAGRLAADLVAGASPLVDPTPYAYERLVDGRRLAPPSAF